jgi:predicted nucleotide-binding protein (sugar kinase/HSP70/actin superfamily)
MSEQTEMKGITEGVSEQEGSINLDPAYQEMQTAMKEINLEVQDFLSKMKEKYGTKILLAGYNAKYDQAGIWKTSNMNTIEELGLSKIIGAQY